MTHRRFTVETRADRGLFRRSPEQILIDREDDADRAAGTETCPLRADLNRAWHAYAEGRGFPEAKGWAAARAHYDPRAHRDTQSDRFARADAQMKAGGR